MSFLAIIAALLLEQLRPITNRNPAYLAWLRYTRRLERHLDGGQRRQGVVAWLAAVVPVAAAGLLVWWLLDALSPLLGLAWNAAVLYLVMGFRKFSHYVTEIEDALERDDLAEARRLAGQWGGGHAAELDAGGVVRRTIELGLLGAHRNVFGVMLWFLVLPGPLGALLYRMAQMLAERWGQRGEASGEFGAFARELFRWMDWLPARLTALAFAIVGNFEDAVDSWRSQAVAWEDELEGIVLASGAGALGVRLGGAQPVPDAPRQPELGLGEEPDPQHIRSAVGLVWRALILCLLLLLFVTIAGWLG